VIGFQDDMVLLFTRSMMTVMVFDVLYILTILIAIFQAKLGKPVAPWLR